MASEGTMEAFAMRRSSELLDDAVFAMHDALRLHSVESVHRMRVSIRRFQQALRVWEQYYPKSGHKLVRKRLRKAMRAAGEVRNLDIALGLVRRADVGVSELQVLRIRAKNDLRELLERMLKKDIALIWREELGLAR